MVVHGDTTSTLAATLAATGRQLPVAHVEAGLRTGDPSAPFPEEGNRRVVDALSALHLAPTQIAGENLLAEGIDAAHVHVTGNPVVDALQRLLPRVRDPGARDRPGTPSPGPRVLVTMHRRESQGAVIAQVCRAIACLAARGHAVCWPLHPAPAVAEPVRRALGGVAGVQLRAPLSHLGFLRLLDGADLVVTDSGGVQEEAALLGRPTLVLRRHTERPEILQTGVVRLIDPAGGSPDAIVQAAIGWLDDPPTPIPGAPLGDGRSGPRIAAILARALREGP